VLIGSFGQTLMEAKTIVAMFFFLYIVPTCSTNLFLTFHFPFYLIITRCANKNKSTQESRTTQFFLGLFAERQKDRSLPERFFCEGSVVSERDKCSFDELDDMCLSDNSGNFSNRPPQKRVMHSSQSSRSTRRQLHLHGKVVLPPDHDESPTKRNKDNCVTKPKPPPLQPAIPKKAKTQKHISKEDEMTADVVNKGNKKTKKGPKRKDFQMNFLTNILRQTHKKELEVRLHLSRNVKHEQRQVVCQPQTHKNTLVVAVLHLLVLPGNIKHEQSQVILPPLLRQPKGVKKSSKLSLKEATIEEPGVKNVLRGL
jgi:hypothetical protein